MSVRPSRRQFLEWAAAAGVSSAIPGSALAQEPIGDRLNVYNWSDYIGRSTIKDFSKEFGVKVVYDTYESNEEMLAKISVGGSGYDLVFPSADVVSTMIRGNLLAPLQKDLLPNAKNIAPLFLQQTFDPGNVHSLPYQWGTSGIAFRTDKMKSPPDSWAVFHDTALSQKMTQLDDMHDVLGAWLKYRGHSLNSSDPEQLKQAQKDAIQAKALLKAYISGPVKNQLLAGEVWVAHLWSGDAAQCQAEMPGAVGYAVPKEGGAIWTDCMAIPASAPHKRAAHAFIDFVLRGEVGAEITTFTQYGSPNEAAMKLLPKALPYPSAEELAKLEYFADLGPALELWDRLWTEIKAA